MHAISRTLPTLVAILVGGSIQAAEVAAQATLELRVQSAEDLRPLSGARVVVEGMAIPSMTDSNGFVRLANVPPGSRRVEVQYLGYRPGSEIFFFESGEQTVADIRLQIAPIELAEVRVTTRSDILRTRGFYERQRGGQGTFLTRAEIDMTQPRYLSDVLRRVAGINVGAGSPRPSASIRGGQRGCPIQYYIDGTFTAGFNIDEVQATDVEGLEIYRGASSVPPMYNKGTAGCGVILIWTRID